MAYTIDTGITATGNGVPSDYPKIKTGRFTHDASLTATDYLLFECGFTPKYVRVVNVTDRIQVEWFEGMADDTCLKRVAAGDMTLETTNKGITITDNTGNPSTTGRCFCVSKNATLAVITADDVHTWIAIG